MNAVNIKEETRMVSRTLKIITQVRKENFAKQYGTQKPKAKIVVPKVQWQFAKNITVFQKLLRPNRVRTVLPWDALQSG